MAKKKGAQREFLTGGWTIEYLAALLSVLSLLGLVILLASTDGRPVFDWHGVTVNALVAVFSTASRASMMVVLAEAISQTKWIMFHQSERTLYDFELVDLASRGDFGRVELLWRLPTSLASIGAPAALLSLAFDPFAQQLVRNEVAVKYVHDSSAELPLARRYDGGTFFGQQLSSQPRSCAGNNSGPTSDYGLFTYADFDMQAAVFNGLQYKPLDQTVQQLSPTCRSGNCSWDPVDSLAVCSRCTDLRDQLRKYDTFDQQWLDFQQDNSPASSAASTAFSLPNGLWLENMNNWTYSLLASGGGEDAAPYGIYGASIMSSYGTGDTSRTIALQDIDTLIWSQSVIRVYPEYSRWPNMSIGALECGLYYCVNTFTTNVTNGVVYETQEPKTSATRQPDSWQPYDSYTFLTEAQMSSLQFDQCVSSVPRTDLEIGEGFNMSQTAINSISSFVNSTFALGDTIDKDQYDKNRTKIQNGYYIETATGYHWQPSTMQPLMQSPNFTHTFATIARSMTNALRRGSGDTASGNTGRLHIVARVNWPWITLPVVVVLAGLAQLVLSVWSTRTTNAPIWKSSSLPVLSRGQHVSRLLWNTSALSGMEAEAKQEQVDLFPEKHGIGLARVSHAIVSHGSPQIASGNGSSRIAGRDRSWASAPCNPSSEQGARISSSADRTFTRPEDSIPDRLSMSARRHSTVQSFAPSTRTLSEGEESQRLISSSFRLTE